MLHLMGKYLPRGAMRAGLVEASVERTPHGGPLTPLLANIYLDALDHWMRSIKNWNGGGMRFAATPTIATSM
ncbi:MAG: hypothetical protein M3Y57_22970 [Acidobacteriota bacterium]|nr:hypothetical protein [Acidobacteriota bacterium]